MITRTQMKVLCYRTQHIARCNGGTTQSNRCVNVPFCSLMTFYLFREMRLSQNVYIRSKIPHPLPFLKALWEFVINITPRVGHSHQFKHKSRAIYINELVISVTNGSDSVSSLCRPFSTVVCESYSCSLYQLNRCITFTPTHAAQAAPCTILAPPPPSPPTQCAKA